MGEKLCALRKIGGGTLKETILWTNPSPTSTFARQTINLSQDINNFDYLKIKALGSTTNNLEISIYISVDDFKKGGSTGSVAGPALYGANTGGTARRAIYYSSSTTILVDYAEGGNTQYNNIAIPLQIIGLG